MILSSTGQLMTAQEVFDRKLKQLAEEKIAMPAEKLKQLAEESMRVPLDFRASLTAGNPGIVAPIPDRHGTTPESAGDTAGALVCAYQSEGANCLAVESRWRFYSEKTIFMRKVRQNATVPILCCGYTIEEYQIHQALLIGADAVLLIGQLLSNELQFLLVSEAHKYGLQTVTLVHSSDLAMEAAKSGTDVVAASNAQGEESFDLALTKTILANLLPGPARMSFGGIATRKDLDEVVSYGAQGALVETAFMASRGAG